MTFKRTNTDRQGQDRQENASYDVFFLTKKQTSSELFNFWPDE